MSNAYAEHASAKAMERIAGALERIADGIERYADADPLTVLHEAMQGADQEGIRAMGDLDTVIMPQKQKPQAPYASNGHTVVYRHPDPRFEVVLRQDRSVEGGYVAMIERA